jgi:hypothetical protein
MAPPRRKLKKDEKDHLRAAIEVKYRKELAQLEPL